jgi:hypothetical protein
MGRNPFTLEASSPPAKRGAILPVMSPMRREFSAIRPFLRGIVLLIMIPCFGLSVTGCAGRQAAGHAGGSYLSPEAALRTLAAPTPAATITATARIQISHNEGRHSLKVALMMRRPAFLRVESIPLMGPPDFFLSVANDQLRVFLPGQGKGAFYVGRATPQNLSRFFPLALPAAEMVSVLLGEAGPPGNDGKTLSSLRGEQEDELYRVDQYLDGRKLRSLWIDPVGHLLVRLRMFAEDGDIAYTADFSEHVRVGEGRLPQRVAFSITSLPGMTVRYADPQQIADDTDAFPLAVPEGVIPISLD